MGHVERGVTLDTLLDAAAERTGLPRSLIFCVVALGGLAHILAARDCHYFDEHGMLVYSELLE